MKKSAKSPVVKVVVQRKPQPPVTLRQRALECLNELKKRYEVLAQNHPLALGINKQIGTEYAGPQRLINAALHFHTHSKPYLRAIINGESRRDLQNFVVDPVDKNSRKCAAALYQKRYQKSAAHVPTTPMRWKATLVRRKPQA